MDTPTAFWIKRKITVAFTVAVVTLLCIAGVGIRFMLASQASREWLKHTHNVLDCIQDTIIAMERIETSYRGFQLYPEPTLLEPYYASKSEIYGKLTLLDVLTKDNPIQQAHVDALKQEVDIKVAFGEEVIHLRAEQGLDTAISFGMSGHGVYAMQRFTERAEAMRMLEESYLITREESARSVFVKSNYVLLVGTLLGLIITSLAGLSVYQDKVARARAEELLIAKVEELNRSNEELGHFAYVASHDLQEPLRMVASYTQLLQRRYPVGKSLDAEAMEFIAFAVDGASRMQQLIQDLLAYSRVGTKGSPMVEVYSENALLQALSDLRTVIKETGAEIYHTEMPHVIADELQLTQVFQNLISNGIKYQKPGNKPVVNIRCDNPQAGRVVFYVEDNGLGIEPQYFTQIFGMFQRLHGAALYKGTGIGLAICKKILERHGGTISVHASTPGVGTTFKFDIGGA